MELVDAVLIADDVDVVKHRSDLLVAEAHIKPDVGLVEP